jgi:hypothetical protein
MPDPQIQDDQPKAEPAAASEHSATSAPLHTPYEKTTADLRKEEESAFPFSVIVGQVYEGPYDLLLDLVRRQNIDIYDIPIAKITAQFLAYVEHLKASDVDTAGEFIYMSACSSTSRARCFSRARPSNPRAMPKIPAASSSSASSSTSASAAPPRCSSRSASSKKPPGPTPASANSFSR